MRHLFLLFVCAILVGPAGAAVSDPGNIGVGGQVGTMGAVTGKYWIMDQAAADFGIEFLDHAFAVYYADFLWHIPKLLGRSAKFWRESVLYFGGGAGVGFWDRADTCGRWNCTWNSGTGTGNGFFLRGVVGIEWYPAKTRFGVYGELAPSYVIYPSGGSHIDLAVGGRYYF